MPDYVYLYASPHRPGHKIGKTVNPDEQVLIARIRVGEHLKAFRVLMQIIDKKTVQS